MEPSPGAGGSLVFAGSPEQDVAMAQAFWNSATLPPPLESRLTRRRESSLNGSSRRGSAAKNEAPSARPSVDNKNKDQRGLETVASVKMDVKQQYLKKAKRREEIMALLKKQREERILKESLSNLHKSKSRMQQSKDQILESDLEDKESVKALH